jgi:hypothetical protein
MPVIEQAKGMIMDQEGVAGRPGQWVLAAGRLAACRLSLLPSLAVFSPLLADSPLFL